MTCRNFLSERLQLVLARPGLISRRCRRGGGAGGGGGPVGESESESESADSGSDSPESATRSAASARRVRYRYARHKALLTPCRSTKSLYTALRTRLENPVPDVYFH